MCGGLLEGALRVPVVPVVFEQMTAPSISPVAKMSFVELGNGYFRLTSDKKSRVYFAMQWGKWTLHYPVRKDGLISRSSDSTIIYPNETIEVLHMRDLGIPEIKLAD